MLATLAALILLAVLAVLAVVGITWWQQHGQTQGQRPGHLQGRPHGHDAAAPMLQPGSSPSAEQIARGQYLAQAGNCAGCHTAPGGADYAGGVPLRTPFGTVYGGNLTPDAETGLGRWTAQDFWHALHEGRSRDGRLLNPAFPYENFSLIRREDSDALYAYLQTLPAVSQPAKRPDLRFPANTQWGLALWRTLHFPAPPPEPPALARGEYLTRGLAHCSACHATRNALGAQAGTQDFSGQLMPGGRAYAPPLPPAGRADVGPWTIEDLAAYLKTGHSRQGAALGLMAEVVAGSTQHLQTQDLKAMAEWILSRPGAQAFAPATPAAPTAPPAPPAPTVPTTTASPAAAAATVTRTEPGQAVASGLGLGARLYSDHCATCHGAQGQGVAGLYPPLAGNPRVARDPATNLIRIILEGGFGPATEGHPRPFGMPPFGHVFKPEEVAAVATYIRQQWNGSASEVTPLDVLRHR